MISTPEGELWSDFELITMGTVESDLAFVGPEDLATYDAAAVRLGLRPLDAGVLRVTDAAGQLAMIAALAMAPQLPMLVEGVAPMIDVWRSTPPLTEI